MRNTLKIFFFILALFLSFVISILFWKNISLSYANPGGVIGFYSDNSLSHYNNLIHFIVFTGFPILTFFILFKRFFYKEVIITNILFSKKIDLYKRNNTLNPILVIAFLIITINYFSLNLVSNTVDYFHEGITLSAAFNYHMTGLFWEGSYLSNSLAMIGCLTISSLVKRDNPTLPILKNLLILSSNPLVSCLSV